MKKYWVVTITIIFSTFFLTFGGCAPRPGAPTKFYILSPMPGPELEKENEAGEIFMIIGIGPVHLPKYLDRPEIVTRISSDELELSELNNWAEPLQANFTRVLIDNMSRLLRSESIAIFPWKSSPQIDYRISIEVIRFDGELGGKASLVTRWTVINSSTKSVFFTKKSQYTESVDGTGYIALVAAQSRMLGSLSRDIAEAVKSLHK